jgi:hypothetical protein
MAIKKFYIDNMELLDNLIVKIRKGVLQQDNVSYITNVKAKMTSYKFFNEGNGKPEFDEIRKLFPQYNIADIWGNIYNKGDKAIEHHHTNVKWGNQLAYGQYATSGIIYLTDSEQGTVFTKLGITEKAEKGKVILFSPKELHEVPEIKEEERITIGFNAYPSYA